MKNRTLALLTVIFLISNIMIGTSHVRMTVRMQKVLDQKYACTELVKAWDNLLQEQNADYVQMSRIALKHINSEQLNLEDLPIYDRLIANNESLNEWHARLFHEFDQDCK